MKVSVYEDELWPYYGFLTNPAASWGTVIEVDAQTMARWRRSFRSFDKVQNEIAELYRAAGGR